MKKLILLISICIGLYLFMYADNADNKVKSSEVFGRPAQRRAALTPREYQLYRNQMRAANGFFNAWEPYPLYSWDRWYWPAGSYYDPGFRSGFWRN